MSPTNARTDGPDHIGGVNEMVPDPVPEGVAGRLDGAITASNGIDLRDPDLLREAAALIRRLAGERDRLARQLQAAEDLGSIGIDTHATAREVAKKFMRQADAAEARALKAEAERDGLRGAVEPFATFAREHTDENGWTIGTGRDRLGDWFGPTEFQTLLAALSSTQGEK